MERMKRTTAMKQTWNIKERLLKDNYKRKMKMFNALLSSIALYGAKVWGWRNVERLKRIKRKYVKWILRPNRRTPNFSREDKDEGIKIAIKRSIKSHKKPLRKPDEKEDSGGMHEEAKEEGKR